MTSKQLRRIKRVRDRLDHIPSVRDMTDAGAMHRRGEKPNYSHKCANDQHRKERLAWEIVRIDEKLGASL